MNNEIISKSVTELFERFPCSVTGDSGRKITSVEYDSRKASDGSLLFCLKGVNSDGHDYAKKAYASGCRSFVVERLLDLPEDATQILVDNTRHALALVSAVFYGNPAEDLTVIGITGTKGKTTSALLIEGTLNRCGIKCAYIGTNGVDIGDEHYDTVNSTPESRELHRFFRMMVKRGYTHVAMEVSSQALDNYRVAGIRFDTVVFTNLSPDHIGVNEHSSFEEYRDAKRKLFSDHGASVMITNADDPNSPYMSSLFKGRVITTGITNTADFRAVSIRRYRDKTSLGVEFDLTLNGETTRFRLRNPGEFSVYNGLCAIAVASCCGIPAGRISEALGNVSVRGRFEIVDALDDITFIVDYAHNGLSLTKALAVLREYGPRRLICLFGCIGGRTYGRRRELAETSCALADYTILTTDNPDNEDPDEIIRDVLTYFDVSKEYTAITDREEAVRYAVRIAQPGDIVIFAGKGHETYQIVNGERVPFSEKNIILDEASRIKDKK